MTLRTSWVGGCWLGSYSLTLTLILSMDGYLCPKQTPRPCWDFRAPGLEKWEGAQVRSTPEALQAQSLGINLGPQFQGLHSTQRASSRSSRNSSVIVSLPQFVYPVRS